MFFAHFANLWTKLYVKICIAKVYPDFHFLILYLEYFEIRDPSVFLPIFESNLTHLMRFDSFFNLSNVKTL
jgi:hypothetical protein